MSQQPAWLPQGHGSLCKSWVSLLRVATLRVGYRLWPAGLDSKRGPTRHVTATAVAPADSGQPQESPLEPGSLCRSLVSLFQVCIFRVRYLLWTARLDSKRGLRSHVPAAAVAPADSGQPQESPRELGSLCRSVVSLFQVATLRVGYLLWPVGLDLKQGPNSFASQQIDFCETAMSLTATLIFLRKSRTKRPFL